MKEIVWFFIIIVILGVISGLVQPKKKRRNKKRQPTGKTSSRNRSTSSSPGKNVSRSSKTCRPDNLILMTPLNELNGVEFERLLALYFRDQGYKVHEVGVGGNDGGVDLVIIDNRGEKTAVQAKCYADHNLVPVQTVRELVGAKRNHNCILTLLVTTSDLTGPAKKEAEQFRVEYWHGGLVEEKLRRWSRWQVPQKSRKKA